MGWSNPEISWGELEKRLSGRAAPQDPEAPISTRKRKRVPHRGRPARRTGHAVRRAALPLQLQLPRRRQRPRPPGARGDPPRPARARDHRPRRVLRRAALRGDGEGVRAEHEHGGLDTIYGAELSLGLTKPQNGVADPEGSHLLVLARGVEGYHRLAAAITEAQLRGDEKGRPVYDLQELAERGRDSWLVLTGCRKGSVRQALAAGGPTYAASELDRLTALFGHDNVAVELTDHGFPGDSATTTCWRRWPPITGCRWSRPTTSTTRSHPDTGSPVRWQRSAPGAAWPTWTAGCPPRVRPACAREPRWRVGSPGSPVRSPAASPLADEVSFDLQKATPRLPKFASPTATRPSAGCAS